MSNLMPIADVLFDAEVFTDGDWVETKDQDPDGDVRLTQLADVGDGKWINKSARFLTSAKARKLRCTYLRSGDLLVARMPDPLGRCCVFPGDPMPSVTVVDVCVIRPNRHKVDNRYLMHVINAPHGRRGIARHITGTTRQRVSRRNLGKVKIPLPPLAEQKRIAGILDAADALRAKRREALAQLDTLLQSTFLDMFGDPVTNPMGWETYALGEVGEVITGNTPSRKRPEYYGDDIEWIKSDNINDPSFVLTEAVERLSVTGRAVARTIPRGSILVTCIAGSPSCIGNAAIADREVAFNQQINAFVPGERIALWFAFGVFWVGKRLVQSASTSSMKGMVSKSAFSAISIPIPPTSLQNRFATIAKSVEQQKASQRAHLDELDTLFASLQSRAFRGDL